MYYNINCCMPTYLVTSITPVSTSTDDETAVAAVSDYTLIFRTQPTLLNGSVIKFRISDAITSVQTAGIPVKAQVNVNGTSTAVPLYDCIGNLVRTGDDLRTRTVYTAVFGSDANHLQIVKVNGRRCLDA